MTEQKITEQEFWDELEKHRGEFWFENAFPARRVIRCGDDEPLCPLAVVTGAGMNRRSVLMSLCGFETWAARIMKAADDVGENAIRARLCEVLGLVE